MFEEEIGHHCKMIGVKDNSAAFLQYVNKLGLSINQTIKIVARQPFDDLIEIEVNKKISSVSPKFAENIIIECAICNKKTNA